MFDIKNQISGMMGSALSSGTLMTVVMGLVQNSGGVSGLLGKFKEAGLGDKVESWLGSGENASLQASDIESVFDSNDLSSAAEKLGVDKTEAVGKLADFLPTVIDKLSPNGNVEKDDESSLSSVLGNLLS